MNEPARERDHFLGGHHAPCPSLSPQFNLRASLAATVREKPAGLFDPESFFLGAGFMLIDTRVLTVLGVSFGNTWLLVPFVVRAVADKDLGSDSDKLKGDGSGGTACRCLKVRLTSVPEC